MKSRETRLFVRSTAFCKLLKTGPLWGESSGDRRDSPTKGQWWQLSVKWRHDQCKDVIGLDRYHMANPPTHTHTQKKKQPLEDYDLVLLFLHQLASGKAKFSCISVIYGKSLFWHINRATFSKPKIVKNVQIYPGRGVSKFYIRGGDWKSGVKILQWPQR